MQIGDTFPDKLPPLSRRARVLLLAAVGLIALLLVGPRVVDEPMVELRAFAGLVREFCSQSGEFVVPAGLARRESFHAATRVFHSASIRAARFMVARLRPASFQRLSLISRPSVRCGARPVVGAWHRVGVSRCEATLPRHVGRRAMCRDRCSLMLLVGVRRVENGFDCAQLALWRFLAAG